jgi:hypothetical protein
VNAWLELGVFLLFGVVVFCGVFCVCVCVCVYFVFLVFFVCFFVFFFCCCPFVGLAWLQARIPFALDDPADHQTSLYGASKRSNELIARAYLHLYNISVTGLRFFTVYGEWGRPDMAMYEFVDKVWCVLGHGG